MFLCFLCGFAWCAWVGGIVVLAMGQSCSCCVALLILLDFLQGISVRVFSWERDFTVSRFQSSGAINILY